MESEWRLVGREAEGSRLGSIARGESSVSGALLSGNPGVGKTALLRHVTVGGPSIWITGNQSTRDVPLAAFADWLPVRPDGSEPSTVLRRTLDACAADVAAAGAVLVVDDAHLLDSLSALLVQRLVLGRHARVLLAARSTTALPEAIARLVGDGWVERIDLDPLSEADVAVVLTQALGHPVETHSLRRLVATTGGGTRFLRELVASELANGGLHLEEGRWYWNRLVEVPHSVIDLVLARLDSVDASVRDVCELLALCEPLDVATLEHLTSPDAVKAAEAAQECVSAPRPDTRTVEVRLRHPLTGDALRSALSTARRRSLARRLATALAERDAEVIDDRLIMQRALLCADAPTPADAELLTDGARRAAAWYDFALSVRLADAAVDAGGGFAARLLRATGEFRLGHLDRAAAEMRALLATTTDDIERLSAGTLLAGIEFWGLGETEAAAGRLAEVLDPDLPPALTAYPRAFGACFAFFDGDTTAARRAAGAVLSDPESPDGARLWAAAAATITAGFAGRLTEALDTAAVGHATIAATRGTGFVRLPVACGEIYALGLAGRLAEAQRRAEDLESCTQDAGEVDMNAAGSYFLGQVAWWRGDLDAARHHLSDALSELSTVAPGFWREQALAAYAPTLAALGELDAAADAVAQLADPAHPHHVGVRPLALLARAWVATAMGHTRDAARLVDEGCELAESLDQPAMVALILHAVTRWGGPVDRERLRATTDRLEGPFGPLAAAHAEALAAHDGTGLDAVADGWAAIGRLGSAADAAAQAVPCHRRAGATARAHALARRARLIAADTGARTPALITLSLPDELTRRETEVATLAAQGRSNADIAEALFISVRTVEGHLNRIYAKMQVTGRHELAEAWTTPTGH